jgi:hypothetical protein
MGVIMRLRLLYNSFLMGEIDDPLVHQGTWFGSFRPQYSLSELSGIEERLFDYIAFAEACNPSARSDLTHDSTEFDAFADVIGSGSWCLRIVKEPRSRSRTLRFS